MKKLTLAFIALLAICTSAFAGGDGSQVISIIKDGETNYYKVFADNDWTNNALCEGTGAYSGLVNINGRTVFNGLNLGEPTSLLLDGGAMVSWGDEYTENTYTLKYRVYLENTTAPAFDAFTISTLAEIGGGVMGNDNKRYEVWGKNIDVLSRATVSGTYKLEVELYVNGTGRGIKTATFSYTSTEPVADFSPSVNKGLAPLNVSFTNISENATSYSWNFDGTATSTDESPSYTFTTPGVYNVSLTINGDDAYTTTKTITVLDPALYGELLGGGDMEIADASEWTIHKGSNPQATDVTWGFTGSGIPTGGTDGALWINCTGTAEMRYYMYQKVSLLPDEEYNFSCVYNIASVDWGSINVFLTETAPVDGQEINENAATIRFINRNSWDNNISTGNVTVNSTGNIINTGDARKDYYLVVKANIGASGGNVITILFDNLSLFGKLPPTPKASFIATPNLGNYPLEIQFTSTSRNATQYEWNFGDGSTSNEANPKHTYTVEGTYDVSLTVSNEDGTDTMTKTSFIKVLDPTSLNAETVTDGDMSNESMWNIRGTGWGVPTAIWDNEQYRLSNTGNTNIKLFQPVQLLKGNTYIFDCSINATLLAGEYKWFQVYVSQADPNNDADYTSGAIATINSANYATGFNGKFNELTIDGNGFFTPTTDGTYYLVIKIGVSGTGAGVDVSLDDISLMTLINKGTATNLLLEGAWHATTFANFGSPATITSIDITGTNITELPAISGLNPNCLVYTSAESVTAGLNNYINGDVALTPIVLTDKAPFHCPTAISAEQGIEYTRDCYTDGGWETIILPFTPTEFTNSGSYLLEGFTEEKTNTLSFTALAEGSMPQANIAYIMKHKTGTSGTETVTFEAATGDVVTAPATTGFRGVFAQESGAGKYFLNADGDAFGIGKSTSYIPAFRACYDTTAQGGAPERFSVEHDDNGATDINAIINTSNAQAIDIYSITGHKITTLLPGEGNAKIESLPKGLYIIGNRKVSVQ